MQAGGHWLCEVHANVGQCLVPPHIIFLLSNAALGALLAFTLHGHVLLLVCVHIGGIHFPCLTSGVLCSPRVLICWDALFSLDLVFHSLVFLTCF